MNQSFILDSTGPVKLAFEVVLNTPLRIGHHGIALYNSDRNLVGGTVVDNWNFLRAHTVSYMTSSCPYDPVHIPGELVSTMSMDSWTTGNACRKCSLPRNPLHTPATNGQDS